MPDSISERPHQGLSEMLSDSMAGRTGRPYNMCEASPSLHEGDRRVALPVVLTTTYPGCRWPRVTTWTGCNPTRPLRGRSARRGGSEAMRRVLGARQAGICRPRSQPVAEGSSADDLMPRRRRSGGVPAASRVIKCRETLRMIAVPPVKEAHDAGSISSRTTGAIASDTPRGPDCNRFAPISR